MKIDSNKKSIEQNKRLSQSAIWQMQRDYFHNEGINAWVSQVPFYITSNPYIANCYAQIVLSFIKDWTKNNPESKNHPFYIMELGTGSGRFSFYFVKRITELLNNLKMNDIKICYVMSDFTENNLNYWESHPALKPFVDQGILDFAIYDMEQDKPITLVKKNIQLDQNNLINPLTVFANYIFDTITQDSFTIRNGKLHELLFSLSTDKNNIKANKPVDMEQLTVDYNIKEVSSSYYGDPHIDSILEEYKNKLQDSSILFPIGSFNAIKLLRKLANDKLLIISTDKGYNNLETLDRLGYPSILFHGSFSLMVNFHALAAYFKNSGGDAYLQKSRKGIKTSVFSSGFKLSELPELALSVEEHVDAVGPGDYFQLHTRMSEGFHECNLATLGSHMQFAHWDPHMYLKLGNHIISKVEQEDMESIQFFAENMEQMAANFYYIPETPCVLFDIGIFYHAIKKFPEAVSYYKKSIEFVGEQFGLYYNLALCQHQLGDDEDALLHFRKAKALDENSKEAEQWIFFLESKASS